MSCNAENSLLNLIAVFKKYASKDEDTNRLSKSELKELLQNEFPALVDSSNSDEVNQILVDLDQDGDGQVDITEYFVTLAAVGVVLYELSKACE